MQGNKFDFYKSGIFDEPEEVCSTDPEEADHGMVACGWGVTTDASKKKFFILRNSWGTSWGEKGKLVLNKPIE